MTLERLEGRATSRGPLRLADVRRGRFKEERDADVCAGSESRPVARVKTFAGRPAAGIFPWIEASLVRGDEGFAAELLLALAAVLPPGGYLMVAYGDDETEHGLKRGFPAAVTPLGQAMFEAGCRWFKDWYYPEGGLEGGPKLQGNKPLTEAAGATNAAALRSEIEAWLTETAGLEDEAVASARRRAHAVIGALASR